MISQSLTLGPTLQNVFETPTDDYDYFDLCPLSIRIGKSSVSTVSAPFKKTQRLEVYLIP